MHQDSLSLTSVVTASNGSLVSAIKFYSFGETRSATGTLTTDKQFTGQRLDDTGLYYYGARYYDAEIGRFISPDNHWDKTNMIYGDRGYRAGERNIPDYEAIKQSTNLYAYALNNPLRYRDPSGLKAGDEFESADAAAKDFGMCYNSQSIAEGVEYGTYIYSITYEATVTYSFFGFTWEEKTTVTIFSYTEPHKGTVR